MDRSLRDHGGSNTFTESLPFAVAEDERAVTASTMDATWKLLGR